MSVNNVERVRAPTPDVFYRDYILSQRPVIFTNLFDESPLRKVETLEAAQMAFGDIPVAIRSNYMGEYFSPANWPRPRILALGRYLNLLWKDPQTLEICVEFQTPQTLLEQLPLKLYLHVQDDQDLYSNMFVAGTGNSAHLHYDSDQRDVLLYQVFGVKRVAVIHPRETQKLDPLDGTDLRRTSAICLEHASEAERAAFLEYTNGHDTQVMPGETMFIPAMAWHYIDYVTPAMSIGYRLGRNPYTRRLAALFPDPSIDVQALALLLVNPEEASARHSGWLEELERVHHSYQKDEIQRKRTLSQLCLAIRAKYSGIEPIYSIREWERRRFLAFGTPHPDERLARGESAGARPVR
jgi:hypothetical protein